MISNKMLCANCGFDMELHTGPAFSAKKCPDPKEIQMSEKEKSSTILDAIRWKNQIEIVQYIIDREKAKNEALANAEKAFQYMADFFPHCCEDCPCDEFRNKSEQAIAELRRVSGKI